ncbi:unnamed protein product, partial [marine sediment metagenome]
GQKSLFKNTALTSGSTQRLARSARGNAVMGTEAISS